MIGDGIIGVSTAWHLARRGMGRAAILEKGAQVAADSTGKSSVVVRQRYANSSREPSSVTRIPRSLARHLYVDREVDRLVSRHLDLPLLDGYKLGIAADSGQMKEVQLIFCDYDLRHPGSFPPSAFPCSLFPATIGL